MRPTKRFILYCFYCVIGAFSKHGDVYGDATTVPDCYLPDTSSCSSVEYASACYASASSKGSVCTVTGAAGLIYTPVCSGSITSQDGNTGKCVVSCNWVCEYSCGSGLWGVTILSGMLDDTCTGTDGGPACSGKYEDMYWYDNAWCNACPTGSAGLDAPGLASCGASTSFTCLDGYWANLAENICEIVCTGDGVYECDNGLITSCHSGYWNFGGIECVACEVYEVCPQGSTKVAGCIAGYYLDDNDDCHQCIENADCPGGAGEWLVNCFTGYWFNSSTGECTACTGNATTCDANGALTCTGGYFLYDAKCIKCPDNATCSSVDGSITCNNGYYWNSTADKCVGCPSNAATCSHDGFTCTGNTYHTELACPTCPAGVATCTSATDATSCFDGYWLNDATCVACTGNAATCDANGALSCVAGKYLLDRKCGDCPDNATCANGTFTCDDTYYKSNGGCEQCTGDGWYTCTAKEVIKCKDEYCRTSTTTCAKIPVGGHCNYTCSDGSENCPTGIVECSEYSYLDVDKNACYSCFGTVLGDSTYSGCGGTGAGVCDTGYYRDSGVCNLCPRYDVGKEYTGLIGDIPHTPIGNYDVNSCFYLSTDSLYDTKGKFRFKCNNSIEITGVADTFGGGSASSVKVCCYGGGSKCLNAAKEYLYSGYSGAN